MLDAEKESDELDDWFVNKLKLVNTRVLEQTIAKAVGEIVGIEFNCYISGVNYDNGISLQGAKFDVSLSEPRKERFGGISTSASERNSEGSGNDLP